MHGVSNITVAEGIMLVSYAQASSLFMAKTLNILASKGVVVDMISQTPPYGNSIRFSFTASYDDFEATVKALRQEGEFSPMISGGYAKINLFGEEMVTSVGVAARVLAALNAEKIEVAMITTSDLDISLLVRQEDVDIAANVLRSSFSI